ncbi:PTS lactose/cellobiose transporter subunit IIA [Anaeromicropila herbilytica]|uniref:PTS cellobiose transporter subunit IIA n=1 Tax=Anaeromicropila herbilytica TaxID=2785025 RepID=A0A7R7IDI9_9FIRM|nr:PTS lactose/cellobiose transporter subunit IIA [Anaeromicropila herbilytica]BCN31129.1 PTS cellobiose transporter subunit IIA [Anaeromicropila herbilytica]
MNDELVGKIFEMISAAGTARAKYIEAIRSAKEEKFDLAKELIEEGGKCFLIAHNVHTDMLSSEAEDIATSGVNASVSLILVHAEDQMMNAESFRIIAEEFVEVYKKMSGK